MKRHLIVGFGFALAAAVGAASGCGTDTGVPAGEETTAQGEAIRIDHSPQIVAANHFELGGGDVHVTYAPFAEEPILVYRDADQTLTFQGSDIVATPTAAGTLVSVVLRRGIDAHAVNFSLLVPRVQLAPKGSATVVTQGITTAHYGLAIHPTFVGQLDRYTFTALEGTARYHPDLELMVAPGKLPLLKLPAPDIASQK